MNYFYEGFLRELLRESSRRNSAEKLRDISGRNSASFRGETPRNFALGKNLRFLHTDSEDSEQLYSQFGRLGSSSTEQLFIVVVQSSSIEQLFSQFGRL